MKKKTKEEPIRTTGEQRERYEWALEQVLGKERARNGIGTLSEKTIHAILKFYYAPDSSLHEIPLEKCVADIFTGREVIEIQTRSFYRLRTKLERFLALYPVTVVYPIPYIKWVCWIDEETGEISRKRKSPKKGNPYMVFRELYAIRPFLQHPHFHLRLLLMDMEEYRLLNGWSRDKKRGSTRYDRLPVRLEEEVVLDEPRDYLQLLPLELGQQFTSKDLAGQTGIPVQLSQTALLLMDELGVVRRVGKKGNSYLYEISETECGF